MQSLPWFGVFTLVAVVSCGSPPERAPATNQQQALEAEPPPPRSPCEVALTVDFMSARTPTYYSRTLQFAVRNCTDNPILPPWNFAVHSEYFIDWQGSSNWIINHAEGGTVSGKAHGRWQILEPNGTNTMHLKGVIVSRIDAWNVDKITLNDQECAITHEP